MGALIPTKKFRFWCQKVIPLVYDDSLSYYEVLCKVVDYLNHLIEDENKMLGEIEELQKAVKELQQFVDNFDENVYEVLSEVIERYIATMVFFGITDDGYWVSYIPESWDDITFYTTELDIFLPIEPEYGHLVLAY